MTNVVILKNRLGIEWTVRLSHFDTTYASKAFSLQSCICHLECDITSSYCANLYFKSNKELQPPVNVTICISNSNGSVNIRSARTIASANEKIWSYSFTSCLSYLFTFEIIIGEFCYFF